MTEANNQKVLAEARAKKVATDVKKKADAYKE